MHDCGRKYLCHAVDGRKVQAFPPKEICDASKSIEVLVCLSCGSREKVDEMVRKAVAAGGTTCSQLHDHGFIYVWAGVSGS